MRWINLCLLVGLIWTPLGTADGPLQSEVDEAIDRGVERLLAGLRGGGQSPFPDKGPHAELRLPRRPGTRALLLYTLLKCGVDRDAPAVQMLVSNLSFEDVQDTYTAGCLLLALEAYDPLAERAWIEELAERLIGWQTERGWAYPSGSPDLSNTQYAALGLWAAARAGVEVDSSIWQRLADSVLDYQNSGGGFSYHPSKAAGTGSMTAAGVGTLALCEAQLRLDGSADLELLEELQTGRSKGLSWLAAKFSADTNPNSGAWLFYYLYGLERVGAFCGADRFGEHDWYNEGAAELLERQHEDGSWADLFDPAQSCFALLFLRRATSGGRRAPETGGGARPAGFDPKARVRLRVLGMAPIECSIDGFSAPVRRDLEWSGERGRGLHIERVEYFLDDQLAAVLLVDGRESARGRSFRGRFFSNAKGKFTVRADVHVLTRGRGQVVLKSAQVEVEVLSAVPTWAHARNKRSIDLSSARATASSTWQGVDEIPGARFGADKAVDGNARHPWLAELSDASPTLELGFKKAIKASELSITPAYLTGFGEDAVTKPLSVKVTVNRKREFRLWLPPQAGQPALLQFGEVLRVRRLELELAPRDSKARFPAIGVGEVELWLDP